MTTVRVRQLRARPVLVPFRRPPMSASGGIPTAALVLIDLDTDAGISGRSYVFGFAPWTLRPIAACLEAGSLSGSAGPRGRCPPGRTRT